MSYVSFKNFFFSKKEEAHMVDLRCYKITKELFDGPVIEQWVQIIFNSDYEEEYDKDSLYYFTNIEEELEGVPVFSNAPDYWNEAEEVMKTTGVVKEYDLQFILVIEYEQLQKIIKNSTYGQIPSVKVSLKKNRDILHYAVMKCNMSAKQVLLVAV